MNETYTPPEHRQQRGGSAPAAALDLCQRRWHAAFTNPLIGFSLSDLERRFLSGNQALERLVGRTAGELRAAPAPCATHPDDREPNLATFRAVAAGQQEQGSYTKRYIHRDGTINWCHVVLILVRTPDGAPHQVVTMVVDITAQVRAEQALRAQRLGLSAMELAILPLLARPDLKSYPEIGKRLCRSGETVRKHAQHIAEKLGLPTAARAEIVHAARKHGLLDLASPDLPGENG
jgi:PAS domain S-box-containing protein